MDNYHALDITEKVKKVIDCDIEEKIETSKVSIETLARKGNSPRLVSVNRVEKKHDKTSLYFCVPPKSSIFGIQMKSRQ